MLSGCTETAPCRAMIGKLSYCLEEQTQMPEIRLYLFAVGLPQHRIRLPVESQFGCVEVQGRNLVAAQIASRFRTGVLLAKLAETLRVGIKAFQQLPNRPDRVGEAHPKRKRGEEKKGRFIFSVNCW